jgi:hypothetical protein
MYKYQKDSCSSDLVSNLVSNLVKPIDAAKRMASTTQFGADLAWPLWESEALEGAFTLQAHGVTTNTNGVVKEVARPWLFGYKAPEPNGRAILILGGGGYVELMVGREGVAVL